MKRAMLYFPKEKKWYSCSTEEFYQIREIRNATDSKVLEDEYAQKTYELLFRIENNLRYKNLKIDDKDSWENIKVWTVPKRIWKNYPQVALGGNNTILFLDKLFMCLPKEETPLSKIKSVFYNGEPNYL